MKFSRARFLPALMLGASLTACGDSPAEPEPGNSGSTSTSSSQEALRADKPLNILLFLIDTQRADYLGMYGHERDTSPNLDAFAQQSLVFDRAYAPASSTSPSHASMFTSTHPRVHGVWNRVPRENEEPIFPALSPNAVTLAEVLSENGYDTAAICDGGNLQENRGFAQGFRTWDSKFLGADNRVDRALRWFDQERQQDRPFFMFLHTYQVHTPYLPKPEHVELFADPNYDGPIRKAWERARDFYTKNVGVKGAIRLVQGQFYKPVLPEDEGELPAEEDLAFLKALYEAEIHQMDAAFGRLMTELAARDITPENTLFLITSDHGEEFWEHGKYGHHQIYDSVAHIPFIARGPGIPAARRVDAVDLLDVMPTLLHWANIDRDFLPPSMLGRVLDFGTSEAAAPYVIVGETNWPEHQLSWRSGDRKAMFFPDSERATELYDFAQDPAESLDLAADETAWLAELAGPMADWAEHSAAWQREHNMRPTVRDRGKMSEDELAELEALGYLVR